MDGATRDNVTEKMKEAHKKHHGPGTLLGDDTTQSSYPQDCQKIKGWWRNPTDKPNLFMIDCDSAAG